MPTPTPTPNCAFSNSSATFDPDRLFCPVGTSQQVVRATFDLSVGAGVPITINGIVRPNGFQMSFSPSVVLPGTTARIEMLQPFECTKIGTPTTEYANRWEPVTVTTTCGSVSVEFANAITIY